VLPLQQGGVVVSFSEADFNSWAFDRNALHINGGKEFFGYGHRCVTHPRLLVIDKYFKRDRSTQRSYMIDGRITCLSLQAALDALSVPPMIGAGDVDLLRKLPSDDWSRPETRAPYLSLADMGLIEWGRDGQKRVTCRLTDAGRAAIAPEAQL
jgi:hypothetical protein